jgi:hypothetical protein
MFKSKYWSDQLKEETNGKYSSKKIWGARIMFLVCLSFILDGLHFYTANTTLFNSMLIAGTTLIGLRTIKTMFSKKDATE